MPLNLDYYYGNEAEQYSFYRIPKTLFTDGRFQGISVEAKVLYGLLLDRMALSVKNGWLDAEGRVYIIFTIADIMETLGCAEQKANKLLNELDVKKGIGLIEKKRRGLGKPNVIYVKNFVDKSKPQQEPQAQNPQKQKKPQIQNCENHKSGNVKTANPELRFSQTNNIYLNDTEFSETDPSIYPVDAFDDLPDARYAGMGLMDGMDEKQSHSVSVEEHCRHSTAKADKADKILPGDSPAESGRGSSPGMAVVDACRELVKENISYDAILNDRPYDKERLDGYVDLIVEVCCSGRASIRVNQGEMPAEAVKGRLLKLGMEHIRYVMDCMDRNTAHVGNIRSYIISALYNAPATISQYYASLVSHDMAEGFGAG